MALALVQLIVSLRDPTSRHGISENRRDMHAFSTTNQPPHNYNGPTVSRQVG